MKKFFKMLLVALIAFVSMANVNAVYDSIYFDDERLVGVNQIKGVGTTYKTVYEYKNGQKGKYLGIGYCFNKSLNAPPDGKLDAAPEGFLPNDEKTNMYIYILDNGYGGSWNTSVIGTGTFSNHEKYYITQVALWIAQGSVNADTIKNSGTLGKAAYNLYSAASKNKTVVAYTPEVILNGNTSMKLSGDKYVSETITLTVKGTDKATVNIVNAPAGSKIVADGKEYNTGVQFKSGTKFTVTVPADKIVQSHTLKVTANTSAIRKKVQIYRYDNNLTYQNIGLIFQEPYKANTELKLNIVPIVQK